VNASLPGLLIVKANSRSRKQKPEGKETEFVNVISASLFRLLTPGFWILFLFFLLLLLFPSFDVRHYLHIMVKIEFELRASLYLRFAPVR
jgi:hypothetical protein